MRSWRLGKKGRRERRERTRPCGPEAKPRERGRDAASEGSCCVGVGGASEDCCTSLRGGCESGEGEVGGGAGQSPLGSWRSRRAARRDVNDGEAARGGDVRTSWVIMPRSP